MVTALTNVALVAMLLVGAVVLGLLGRYVIGWLLGLIGWLLDRLAW